MNHPDHPDINKQAVVIDPAYTKLYNQVFYIVSVSEYSKGKFWYYLNQFPRQYPHNWVYNAYFGPSQIKIL